MSDRVASFVLLFIGIGLVILGYTLGGDTLPWVLIIGIGVGFVFGGAQKMVRGPKVEKNS